MRANSPFDPEAGLLPPGEHATTWDEIQARFGGEFLPNVIEAGSGQEFAAFFQSDRDGTPKGIVVIDPSKEPWT